jgi:hypothetical protein
MKTKQTTIHRSGAKWLPGAMALAATAASSQAATVQITLSGNMISSTGGNQLNADVTGDGGADITFASATFWDQMQQGDNSAGAAVKVGDVGQAAVRVRVEHWANSEKPYAVVMGGRPGVAPIGLTLGFGTAYYPNWGVSANGTTAQQAAFLYKFDFSDPNIRGGAVTNAWLEVRGLNESRASHTLALTRVFYDDATGVLPVFATVNDVPGWAAIPEPSSFALLGLGAAGLLARRRRQAA